MAATLKRYQLLLLGHSEELIQSGLDKITGDIVGVVSVGVNVLAIVDRGMTHNVVPFEQVKTRPRPRD